MALLPGEKTYRDDREEITRREILYTQKPINI